MVSAGSDREYGIRLASDVHPAAFSWGVIPRMPVRSYFGSFSLQGYREIHRQERPFIIIPYAMTFVIF